MLSKKLFSHKHHSGLLKAFQRTDKVFFRIYRKHHKTLVDKRMVRTEIIFAQAQNSKVIAGIKKRRTSRDKFLFRLCCKDDAFAVNDITVPEFPQ